MVVHTAKGSQSGRADHRLLRGACDLPDRHRRNRYRSFGNRTRRTPSVNDGGEPAGVDGGVGVGLRRRVTLGLGRDLDLRLNQHLDLRLHVDRAGVHRQRAAGERLDLGLGLRAARAQLALRTGTLGLGRGRGLTGDRLRQRALGGGDHRADLQGLLGSSVRGQEQGDGAGQSGQRSWAAVLPADGSYSFTALPAGHFTLTLESLGTIQEFDLADGANTAFNYAVGGGPTTGTLEGTLHTDHGEPVTGRRVQVSRDGVVIAEATTGLAGEFRFATLPAGTYQVAVDGAGVLAESVAVAAGQTTTLTLTLPAPNSQKPLPAYTLFSASPQAKQLLGLTLPYLRANGLSAGTRLAEAMQASAVTIVGGEDMISAADEQVLRDAGSQVLRLPGDPFALAETLDL